MVTVTSHGAAKTVTGSCHLMEFENGLKVLIDCGMYQGAEEDKNYEPFGFDPRKIDYLLLTHGHLDHVGRIPLLVKQGFKGIIVATSATFDLAKIVLLDSAKLMEEEYKTRFKKAQRKGKEREVKKPLYTIKDVKSVFKQKKIKVKYEKKIEISKNVIAVFKDAGHIIGSAFIEIVYFKHNAKKRVIFSGDLGNRYNNVLPSPAKPKAAQTVFIESTYGDRCHRTYEDSVDEFKNAVIETISNKGNVLIPSFAIERTQQILAIFKEMEIKRELPSNAKVFLDSPMAIKATKIYKRYKHLLSNRYKKFGNPFSFSQLRLVTNIENSKKINDLKWGNIIIAGSGMCNGGRILHHLKHRLWNEKNSVIFVGFQAKGTLGREIVDGAKTVKIFDEDIIVRAKIYTINGFSAHADQKELLEWIEKIDNLKNIFLIHGEENKQTIFKKAIENYTGLNAHIVEPNEKIFI
ncbi:MBL fold metallo-hydrolase RNA specificity domain-containing protein [Nitrosophilus labii]|uniref:MBL fold metallo-hydrolase RNA specificity domain-containing protein n=1 Tax=Nitrosophilus labii TaxID=2706014 RepID=UPI001656EBA5|nr:MBL fold metallo-hydrolase [Nitrosophilus labii]